jgi:hypothetical protein
MPVPFTRSFGKVHQLSGSRVLKIDHAREQKEGALNNFLTLLAFNHYSVSKSA